MPIYVPVPQETPVLDFITAIAPMLIGLLALWITYWITTKQIRATTVSTSRQRWIDSLRDALSQYMSIASAITCEPDASKKTSLVDKLHISDSQLDLMLSKGDKEHQGVRKAMIRLFSVCHESTKCETQEDRNKNASLFYEINEILVAAAQLVIDAEWDKIKQGK